MARIGDLLVQPLEEDGVVIIDEISLQEVVIPMDHVGRVIDALLYFDMGSSIQREVAA